MKKIILFFLTNIIVLGTILLFSFKTDNAKPKHFTTTCYYYKSGTCNQRIGCNYCNDTDCRKNCLTGLIFKTTSNWTTTTPTCACDDGIYICAICFDRELTADGGCDGQLTLQEALNAVWNYYVSNCDLPANGGAIADCNAVITIYRKSAVC